MVNKNVLLERSLEFGVKIVKLVHDVRIQKEEDVLTREVFKVGTKIGARLREAEFSESLEHFVNCLQRAHRKAIQTEFHLELMLGVDLIDKETFQSLQRETTILRKLIDTNIKSAKQRFK